MALHRPVGLVALIRVWRGLRVIWRYEPPNHCRETWLIFTANRFELQTHSPASLNVPHRGIGFDFSVLDKKMQFNRRADSAGFPCLDEETAHAQIANSRCIFRSAAPPEDPHALRSFNPLVVSS
jgi:hypothetical protein